MEPSSKLDHPPEPADQIDAEQKTSPKKVLRQKSSTGNVGKMKQMKRITTATNAMIRGSSDDAHSAAKRRALFTKQATHRGLSFLKVADSRCEDDGDFDDIGGGGDGDGRKDVGHGEGAPGDVAPDGNDDGVGGFESSNTTDGLDGGGDEGDDEDDDDESVTEYRDGDENVEIPRRNGFESFLLLEDSDGAGGKLPFGTEVVVTKLARLGDEHVRLELSGTVEKYRRSDKVYDIRIDADQGHSTSAAMAVPEESVSQLFRKVDVSGRRLSRPSVLGNEEGKQNAQRIEIRAAGLRSHLNAAGTFCDLTQADLRDTTWRGHFPFSICFDRANLRNADFSSATFRGGQQTFRRAFMEGVNMAEIDLQEANFAEARLIDAGLQSANLRHCNLEHAIMTKAQLQKAILDDAMLFGVNARKACFRKASMERVYLRSAHCKKADFSGSNLRRATLSMGCDLRGADLRMADLRSADLEGAVISSHTALSGAHLNDTNLKGVPFASLRIPSKTPSSKGLNTTFWGGQVAKTVLGGLDDEAGGGEGEGGEEGDEGEAEEEEEEEDEDESESEKSDDGGGGTLGLLANMCADGMNKILEDLVRKALLLLPAAIAAFETAKTMIVEKKMEIIENMNMSLQGGLDNVSQLVEATRMTDKILTENIEKLLDECFERLEHELPRELRARWRAGIADDFEQSAHSGNGDSLEEKTESQPQPRKSLNVMAAGDRMAAGKKVAKKLKVIAQAIKARNTMDEQRSHESILEATRSNPSTSSSRRPGSFVRKRLRRPLSRYNNGGRDSSQEESEAEQNRFGAFRRAGVEASEKLRRSLRKTSKQIVREAAEQIAAIVISLPASKAVVSSRASMLSRSVSSLGEGLLTRSFTSRNGNLISATSDRFDGQSRTPQKADPRQKAVAEGLSAIIDELTKRINPIVLAKKAATARVTVLLNKAGFGKNLHLLGERVKAFESKLLERVGRTKLKKYFSLLKKGAIEKSVRRSRTLLLLAAPTEFSTKTSWFASLRTSFAKKPIDLVAEDNELQFLLEKLNAVEVQQVSDQSWVHVLDSWQALLSLRSKLYSSCAQQVIEAIVSDDDVMQALGMAHALRDIKGGPLELLSQLQTGPSKHIKTFSFDYRRKIQKEIAQIGRIRQYQLRMVALVGSVILSALVGVAQFLSNWAYDSFQGTGVGVIATSGSSGSMFANGTSAAGKWLS